MLTAHSHCTSSKYKFGQLPYFEPCTADTQASSPMFAYAAITPGNHVQTQLQVHPGGTTCADSSAMLHCSHPSVSRAAVSGGHWTWHSGCPVLPEPQLPSLASRLWPIRVCSLLTPRIRVGKTHSIGGAVGLCPQCVCSSTGDVAQWWPGNKERTWALLVTGLLVCTGTSLLSFHNAQKYVFN